MQLTEEEIEEIISNEVEVDCYTEEEAVLGWYYYLTEGIHCPFIAEYLQKNLDKEHKWVRIEVVGFYSNESEFNGNELYVETALSDMLIPARLSELRKLEISDEEEQIMSVWKYRISK